MESVKSQFISELNSLKELVSFFNYEHELLKKDDAGNELLVQYKREFLDFYSKKRIFNYNSIIISLYGYFEKFIENVLVEYIDKVGNIFTKYNKLPEAIYKHHLALSMTLLEKVQNPKYSGPLTKEIVIHNLHKCINLNENYQLNKEAFSQHSANFRLHVIDDVFNRIGISGLSSQVKKHSPFYDYIKSKYEIENIDDLSNDDIYIILNDLAERRNEVAHGVPSQILSNDILLNYIEYFDILGATLINVVEKDLDRLQIKENGNCLGELTACYNNGYVVCFNCKFRRLEKGDYIFSFNNQNYIEKAQILNIRLDDVDVPFTDETKEYEIGLLLDKPFKKNHKLYILK